MQRIAPVPLSRIINRFDVDSLFTLVENTLRRSTHIVDNVVQGSRPSLEHMDDKIPQFNSPLCTLKQISSEMSCKPPSEEIAHKTTVTILNKLSNYEWDTKAVLTLAAFALEYSEFWLLQQHQQSDPLAKSVAVLKRVPVLTRPLALQKHRQEIIEVNNLVKASLQVIEVIFELEKLTTYDTKDVPALEVAIEQIPVDVYWAIITIAAVVTQLDCLTTESAQKQELSHYGQKINIILSKLRKQVTLCRQQIDEVEYYRKLRKLFQTPTEIMEVDVSVLKKKNVYLFISTLDITDEEISVLRPVYDSIKTNDQYKIVVQAYGMKAFPFTTANEEIINKELHWVESVVGNIHPNIDTWIREQKYIFFYGGNDKEWIQQFTKYATALSNDAALKEAKISIELFCVEKEDKSFVRRFWSGIESLFVTKVHRTVDAVTQEVQKMLSYKNETGWALLSKGSSVVLSGHGTTILKTVAEFDKWKEAVIKKGFEFSFKEYNTKIVGSTHRCSHLEIPNIAGKLPETIRCPECPRTMEIFISYKCCHVENTVTGKH
ncbi:hypothetical protein VNO77_13215 [Canavalia gladiata]|uniref:Uncharacterized protein n=1 Tax=Canavalia gladiata TaxID=3824 RepID=A0AAN9M2A3_CANGL